MKSVTEDIPQEILGDVFLLVLAYTPSEWVPNIYASRSRLTSVCRRWRHIAISDPRSWATIVLEERDFKIPTIPFLRLCIERSKNLPLSIFLMGQFEGDEWLESPMFDLVEIVGAEIHRWKSFTFIAYTHAPTPFETLVDLEFDFPSACQLRSIKICVNGRDMDCDVPLYSFYPSLAGLPALKEVSICAADMFYGNQLSYERDILTSTSTRESWARWDRLELTSDMFWEDVVFLFKYCSHVKVMRLRLYLPEEDYDTPHFIEEPLYAVHNTLRALHLNFPVASRAFFPLINALTLPYLEVFQYQDSGTPDPDGDDRGTLDSDDDDRGTPNPYDDDTDKESHWNNFLGLISRSPNLQVLVVNHSSIGQEELLAFISHSTITRIPTVQILIEVEGVKNSSISELEDGGVVELGISDVSELEDNSASEQSSLMDHEDPPNGPENNDWEFYADIMNHSPGDLVQAVLLEGKPNFVVGWAEKWVAFRKFEGVGKLADCGFGLHPVMEQASRPLTW